MDVAVSEALAATLYRNDGAGGFVAEPLAPDSNGMAHWRDLDDDGWPEFITTVFDSTRIEIVQNVSGTLPRAPSLVLQGVDASFVEVADFDGDGRRDVLATRRAGNLLSGETTFHLAAIPPAPRSPSTRLADTSPRSGPSCPATSTATATSTSCASAC